MKVVSPSPAVYLDVCALGRPYDDQRFHRIEVETLAVVMITRLIREGRYILYYSPVHEDEVTRNDDESARAEILMMLYSYGKNAATILDYPALYQRAQELMKKGMKTADSLHVANTEALGAAFITCDDELLNKCRSIGAKTWFGTPVDFCIKEDLL